MQFRDASDARAYYQTYSKDWHWDGFRIDVELSERSMLKNADGSEPRKKYGRKR